MTDKNKVICTFLIEKTSAFALVKLDIRHN